MRKEATLTLEDLHRMQNYCQYKRNCLYLGHDNIKSEYIESVMNYLTKPEEERDESTPFV
jgi:hypothetical protein